MCTTHNRGSRPGRFRLETPVIPWLSRLMAAVQHPYCWTHHRDLLWADRERR